MADKPLWLQLLEQAVENAGPRGKQAVAIRLGVSRSYVSRAMSDGSSGLEKPSGKFIARVIDRLYVVDECPATNLPQPRAECRRLALCPPPTHNPLAMRIWKICHTCQHRPEGEQS